MTDTSTPEVAAVIPARPVEPFLDEAVDSVLRQPEVVELAIATCRRDSPTAQLAESHPDSRVRLVISGGPSAADNLNAGIAATAGLWLAFLDADDRWPAERISAGLRAARASPGTRLVLGQHRSMTASGDFLGDVRWSLLGAALVTREAAEQIGPFDPSLIAPMRWIVRARDLGIATVEVPEVLLYRRVHADNLTRREAAQLREAYLTFARERAQRRRRAGGAD
jgi:glycosyltransferase involved in cell wall biosynthesis